MRRSRMGWLGMGILAVLLASGQAAPDPPPLEEEIEEEFDEELGGGRGATSLLGEVLVEAGDVMDGDVVVIGGQAIVEGTVNGSVVAVAGSLDIRGSVNGDVTGVASNVKLGDRARILGDLVNVGGGMRRGRAQVQGEVVNIGLGFVPGGFGPLGILGALFFWWKLLELVLVFLSILMLCALVPDRIRAVAAEAPARSFPGFFAGIGGYIALAVVLSILVVTILGAPLALLCLMIFWVFKWIALTGLFAAIGGRLGRTLMGRELSLLGAALLGFLPFALLRFVPFLGWAVWMTLSFIAVGLMLLTRAGGRRRPGPDQGLSTAPPPSVGTSSPLASSNQGIPGTG
jgi:hypothetical protein